MVPGKVPLSGDRGRDRTAVRDTSGRKEDSVALGKAMLGSSPRIGVARAPEDSRAAHVPHGLWEEG